MNGIDKKIINQMYATIRTMGVVLNEVSSYNCHGRAEMNKAWTELANMMKELNKPPTIVTADDVKRLREHTGEGMMACKKALLAADGDFFKAADELKRMGNI